MCKNYLNHFEMIKLTLNTSLASFSKRFHRREAVISVHEKKTSLLSLQMTVVVQTFTNFAMHYMTKSGFFHNQSCTILC